MSMSEYGGLTSDALLRMDERIDNIASEVGRLASVHGNVGKLETVLDETRQQVQNLNLHLGKMQSVTETYNKFLGVLLAFTTVLMPIGFSVVGNAVNNNAAKIDSALKTSYDAQKQMEIYKYNLDVLKDKIDLVAQGQKNTP